MKMRSERMPVNVRTGAAGAWTPPVEGFGPGAAATIAQTIIAREQRTRRMDTPPVNGQRGMYAMNRIAVARSRAKPAQVRKGVDRWRGVAMACVAGLLGADRYR